MYKEEKKNPKFSYFINIYHIYTYHIHYVTLCPFFHLRLKSEFFPIITNI